MNILDILAPLRRRQGIVRTHGLDDATVLRLSAQFPELSTAAQRAAEAVPSSAIGHLPRAEDLDMDGITLTAEARQHLFELDEAGWLAEMQAIHGFLDEYGARVPAALKAEVQKTSELLGK